MSVRVQVSDQAVLRYLEQACGWDIAALRRQMAQDVEVALYQIKGELVTRACVVNLRGITYHIHSGQGFSDQKTVVTVAPGHEFRLQNGPKRRKGRRRG